MTKRGLFQRLRARFRLRLVWDVFMVYVALLNVALILFDFTYLWLRPFYFEHVPALTRLYDQVKGIEPHPVTQAYLEKAHQLSELVHDGVEGEPIESALAELREASERLIAEEPFVRSGQSKSLRKILAIARNEVYGEDAGPTPGARGQIQTLKEYWTPGPHQLGKRLELFRQEMQPLLERNYHREYDLSGDLEDHFWLLDLPFLLLFATEFFVRWFLAVRRRTHAKWFMFPILNWYDLLGIIPYTQFRFFRLFRLASIYVRLRSSEHTGIGEDFISRSVAYVSNIITEEISDLVAIRILSGYQEGVRDRLHVDIVHRTLKPRREQLRSAILDSLRRALASGTVGEDLRELLTIALEQAIDRTATLQSIPLPRRILKPLAHGIGVALFDALVETLNVTLDSETGSDVAEQIIDQTIDGVVESLFEGELDLLIQDLTVDAIEEIKREVAVKRWAEDKSTPPTIQRQLAQGDEPG